MSGIEAEADAVRLPRPPGLIRRFLTDHPRFVDIFIVVWYVIGLGIGVAVDAFVAGQTWSLAPDEAPEMSATLTDWFGVPGYLAGGWWAISVPLLAAVGVALFFRRRFPFWGLVVTVLASTVIPGVVSFAVAVAIVFMLYAVPVYRGVAAAWVGYVIAVAGVWVMTAYPIQLPNAQDGSNVETFLADTGGAISFWMLMQITVFSALWYLVFVLVGITLGNRRRYVQAVIDRAHQLARERDQRAQLAVAEERSRIAREMHDVVAHSVSVMIALSEGAARVVDQAPEAATDAMERSAQTGRTALAEMRRLLGALQNPDQDVEYVPQPGITELPDLIAGFEEAGLHIALDITGASSGDRGQELAVYRVVQEGLTNALRYAGTGARAEVTIARLPDRTDIAVRDFGAVIGASAPITGVGSGRGLAGLTERVRVFGGRIEAGPIATERGGGWRLWASVPVGTDGQVEREGTQA